MLDDYELTNSAAKVDERLAEATAYYNKLLDKDYEPEVYQPFLGVRRKYLQTAWCTIIEENGAIDAYLADALGVTNALRKKLVARLVG